ncbi:MAG: N-acetyltransferase [Erysipelotrichaceae bacterium]|nr:N-acetyltransferase [Erysipelotrichaceae bacterium]
MIRQANFNDLKTIMEIYDIARVYMLNSNNPTQWKEGYPSQALIENDIKQGHLYVIEYHHQIHGVFMFFVGKDPTYDNIENGQWLNELDYGVIHRVASDGKVKGIFNECVAFCKQQINNLKIDTHFDNQTMQHVICKNGFKKCGVIYVEDGTARIAYQWFLENKENMV